MKALSIKQPFAELILLGKKKIELRVWNTSFRGEFYIQASFVPYPGCENYMGVDVTKVPKGAIVGTARLVDVKEYLTKEEFMKDADKHCAAKYPFKRKLYGFVLENVKRVKPIPCRGMLNFFEPKINEV
ncbi:MAG: ASCH domain-containing protein [Nanoarchaeota archaeon]|nr:ASCH domain-containing protein [Nanoarchaeota archaeon]